MFADIEFFEFSSGEAPNEDDTLLGLIGRPALAGPPPPAHHPAIPTRLIVDHVEMQKPQLEGLLSNGFIAFS